MTQNTTSDGQTRRRGLLPVLALCGLVGSLMQTLPAPILPEFPRIFGTSIEASTWILTSSLLAAAIATPILGRLSDIFGKRRMVIVILLLVLAGSVICALAPSLPVVIVGRVLQGAGLGVVGIAMSILRDALPAESAGRSVALVSASLGVGAILGLPIAASLAQFLDWQYLFWMAAVLAAVAVVLVVLVVPSSPVSGGTFDFMGAVGLGLGLAGLLVGVSQGSVWGWGNVATLSVLGGGLVILIAWWIFERRPEMPLIDVRMAGRRTLVTTNLASICSGFGYYSVLAVLPHFLEAPAGSGAGLGASFVVASLSLLPGGIAMFFASQIAARLSQLWSPRLVFIVSGFIMAAGYFLAIVLNNNVWEVMVITCLIGLSTGLAYAVMPLEIMGATAPRETASANGLNIVMRILGSAFAAAISGIILGGGASATPTAAAFDLSYVVSGCVALASSALAAAIPRSQGK
jgi:predicted MFS family arabinose efflux permease